MVIANQPATIEEWRAQFARVAEAKANSAIRLSASEPGADYEATILRLLDWRASLERRVA